MPPRDNHSNEFNTHAEEANRGRDRHSDSSRGTLTEQALTLYQCPDGSLVTHPSQCKEQKSGGQLDFSNIYEDLVGLKS